jgi:hypothetical protein
VREGENGDEGESRNVSEGVQCAVEGKGVTDWSSLVGRRWLVVEEQREGTKKVCMKTVPLPSIMFRGFFSLGPGSSTRGSLEAKDPEVETDSSSNPSQTRGVEQASRPCAHPPALEALSGKGTLSLFLQLDWAGSSDPSFRPNRILYLSSEHTVS